MPTEDPVMMKYVLVLLSIAASALAPRAAEAANLITNGSFELPTLTAEYRNHAVASSTLTGWEIVGPAFESVSQVRSDFSGNPGYFFPAQAGSVWLDLAGFVSNSPTAVQQSVATTPGATYDLSFYVGNVSGSSFGTSTTLEVEFGSGRTAFSCTNAAPGFNLTWQRCTNSFVATAAATHILFRNLDPSTDYSAAIDNIALTPASGAVPEPAGWAMMLVGFALVGICLRNGKGPSALRLA
jgi:hypothetical protein